MGKVITVINGIPKLSDEAGIAIAYSESIYYSSGLAANTPITLPNSGYFTSSTAKDIIVLLNDRVVEENRDFDVVGSGPNYTQIQFIYALTSASVVRFIKNI